MRRSVRVYQLCLLWAFVLFLMNASKVAEAASITRGPYLQLGNPNSIVVRWRTDTATDSRVRYGSAPGNLTLTASDAVPTTEHEVKLSLLSPATRYYYAVGSSTATLAGADTNHFFVTHPPVGTTAPARIWVLGDSGTANADQINVRNAYYNATGARHTDLWLMLGDNAYPNGTDADFQAAVFNIYPAMLRKSVLWPTLGNHDTAGATSFVDTYPYFAMFTLPRNAEAGGVASGSEHFYSFDFGNIHFICLDSMTASRATNGSMANWLRNDLAATLQDWIIAFWHHPPYTKGSHNSDTEPELVQMRQNFLPILDNGGVDLVLTGHSHSYERSFLLDGHYGTSGTLTAGMIKDGGSGRGLTPYQKPTGTPARQGAVYSVAGSSGSISGGALNHPAMFVSLNVLGSLVVEVVSNRMDVTFLDSTAAVRDFFAIVKGPVAPRAPTGLTAVPGSNQVALAWNASSGADSYNLKRAAASGGPFGVLASGLTATSYTDNTAMNGTTYYYVVSAVNGAGESANSSEVSATPQVVQATPCLVHWPFNETSGTVALDHSGNANHGVLLNGPARTNGIAGGALRFDGVNDRVVATNPASLNVTGALTVAAWIRPETVSGPRYVLIKGNQSSGAYAYSLRTDNAKIQYRWISPNGTENKWQTTTNVLVVGRWIHVAAAHTPGSAPQLFINGVAVPGSLSAGSAAAAIRASPNPFTVGSSSNGDDRFQGLIDEVFVCPGALTAAQIRGLTNGLPPGPPPPPPALGIATAGSLPNGRVMQPYSQTLMAMGGTPGYTWSIVSNALPAGLSLNTNNGAITGTPAMAETNEFRARVRDGAGQSSEKDFTLVITEPLPPAIVTVSPLPNGTVGSAYSVTLMATGGTPGYTWSIVSNALPAGLSLNTNNGAITGTPTAETNEFRARVRDITGRSGEKDFRLIITEPPPPFILTASPLPGGTVSNAYNTALVASNGLPPYTWTLVNGTLPDGLALNTNGAIGGTPTAPGSNSFRVQVSDRLGRSGEKDFTLAIGNAVGGCLVAYKFEESGTTALDSSGNGNHGALLNGPTRTAGMIGLALRFDGSDDRVNGSNSVSLNHTGALTVAAWVRPESVSGGRTVAIKGNYSSDVYAWVLRASDAYVQYRWVSPNGAINEIESNNPLLAVARWTHLAVVHTPGSIPRLYTNGVLAASSLDGGSASGAIRVTPDPFTVGASSDGGKRFQGLIDEVFVCGSALTTAELRNLMTGQPAGSPPQTQPVLIGINVSANRAQLIWTSAIGQTFRVQYKYNLEQENWYELPEVIVAEDVIVTFEHNLDGDTQRFYRIVSEP